MEKIARTKTQGLIESAGRRITHLDKEMGKYIRNLRLERGMRQSDLGSSLGVSFQQIQKYERGINRMSVSMFLVICQTLNVHPMDFLGRHVDEDAPKRAISDNRGNDGVAMD